MIRIENMYEMSKTKDTKRFLIDREWPKKVVRAIPRKEKSGQTRSALAQIEWCPKLVPSRELWKWFNHEPEKIERFRSRYFRELQTQKKNWAAIASESGKGDVTLLYHGKSVDFTPAQFLKEFLEGELKARRVPKQG